MPANTTIGQRVRLFRALSGYTQQRAALLVGLKQRQFATLEEYDTLPRPKLLTAVQDFCQIIGVRSDYVIRGTPPAIETGWLYYDVPPKSWQQYSPSVKGKLEFHLASLIGNELGNFLFDHEVRDYRVGEAGEQGLWFVYPIATNATLVLAVSREFIPSFDELHRHLQLKRAYKAPLLEKIRPVKLEPGTDLRYLDQIIQIHETLGIGPMTQLWRAIKGAAKDMLSPEEVKRQEAIHRICTEMLKLGIDPADIAEELERRKKEFNP